MAEPASASARVLPWLGLLARLGLAAVFLTSGTVKALDPRETLVAVQGYQLFSSTAASVIASILPFLEIGVGLLLLVGMATRLAAILGAVLLLAFIAGVISAAVRGLAIDCGCFGGGGQVATGATTYTLEILRDVGFLAMAGWLIRRSETPLSVDGFVGRLRSPVTVESGPST